MREIKFRGRDEFGVWHYGFLINYPSNGGTQILSFEDPRPEACRKKPILLSLFSEVNTETVGQYTGLKDKNGKEVCEGDIIKSRGGYLHVIKYKESIASFVALIVYNGEFDDYDYCCVSQKWIDNFNKVVIGNIHDNPELLNNKK